MICSSHQSSAPSAMPWAVRNCYTIRAFRPDVVALRPRMFSEPWMMLKQTVLSFLDDEALSRGAAIAFYTVTSIAPVLLIVIAIAGIAFGHDAAQNAITEQLSGLMGRQTAEVLQTAVASAASKSSGVVATIVGIITLMVAASGVFGE